MNVSLTPELDQFVGNKVASGRYTSASEVVREALRLMEERDQERTAQLAAFQRELGARVLALDRGEYGDVGGVKERIASKSRERRRMKA